MRRQVSDIDAARRGLPGKRQGRAGSGDPGGADRSVLRVDERLGLGRPGHQFGIEAQPVGLKALPQPAPAGGVGDPRDQGRLKRIVGKEAAAGAGVDHPRLAVFDTEATPRRFRIACHHDDRAAAHVLFFEHDLGDPGPPEISQRFIGMFEQAGLRRCLGR